MKYPHLKGLRYANWARRSDVTQGTSIKDQIRVNNDFAADHEMVWVHNFIFEDTGSVPGARDDIPEVIEQCVKQKIPIVLLHDAARLTRSGIEHGMKVLGELKAEGIEAVFVRDDIPGGEWAPLFQTLLFFAANQFSRKLADSSARSSQIALEAGLITHSKCTPFGLDRLILGQDGKPAFRVRNSDNGIQQRLHPEDDRVVLESYEGVDEKGNRCFYSKAKTDTVVYVEGEKQRADLVRYMYRRFFGDGASVSQIRRELNRQPTRSARGKLWTKRTIALILRNPIYTGRGLANTYNSAIYVVRHHGQPQPAGVDFKTLSRFKRPPRRRRPERDWYWREEAHLKDFLPPDIKAAAEEYQRKHLDRIKDGYVPKPGGDPHINSPYILKNLLHSTDDKPMTGTKSGGDRFYAVKHVEGQRRPLIRAEAVEQAVLGVIQNALAEDDGLLQRVTQFVEQEASASSGMRQNVNDIRQQQKRLLAKIEFLIDRVSSDETKALTERKIREAETELGDVNRMLKTAEAEVPAALLDTRNAANAIVARLRHLGAGLQGIPRDSLRRILGHLIERLVVDPETFEIELNLRLPATVLWAAYEKRDPACLVPTVDLKCSNYTHDEPAIKLAQFTCGASGSMHKNRCWKCVRAVPCNFAGVTKKPPQRMAA
jgi:Recombinase/Resolvase, N terminal domain